MIPIYDGRDMLHNIYRGEFSASWQIVINHNDDNNIQYEWGHSEICLFFGLSTYLVYNQFRIGNIYWWHPWRWWLWWLPLHRTSASGNVRGKGPDDLRLCMWTELIPRCISCVPWAARVVGSRTRIILMGEVNRFEGTPKIWTWDLESMSTCTSYIYIYTHYFLYIYIYRQNLVVASWNRLPTLTWTLWTLDLVMLWVLFCFGCQMFLHVQTSWWGRGLPGQGSFHSLDSPGASVNSLGTSQTFAFRIRTSSNSSDSVYFIAFKHDIKKTNKNPT